MTETFDGMPCPWCGSCRAGVVHHMSLGQINYRWRCPDCGAVGPVCPDAREAAVSFESGMMHIVRPYDRLTTHDQARIEHLLSVGHIYIARVVPLHVMTGACDQQDLWECLHDELQGMRNRLKYFFGTHAAALQDALEFSAEEEEEGSVEVCNILRRIGGWIIMGNFATIRDMCICDNEPPTWRVDTAVVSTFFVWGRSYKQAMSRAINARRMYWKSIVNNALEKSRITAQIEEATR